MTEAQTELPTAPAKPKRRTYARKAKPRPRAEAAPSEFAGMTKLGCCDSCSVNRCVVSGINVCAHPNKGGLQAAQLRDPKAAARLTRTKEFLSNA